MATILIVDDKPINRQLLVTLLGYRHHRTLEATDGAAALDLVHRESVDLVICDILMPTMDGYEFVRKLRCDPATVRVPVIFYTAKYDHSEAERLEQLARVVRHLTKGDDPEEILRAVEEALQATTAEAGPLPTEAFDREHLRLLTNKLAQHVDELEAANAQLRAGIREREQAEAALRDSEARLRQLTATLEAQVTARTAESEARAGQLRALALELINAEEYERRRVARLMHDSVQQRLAAANLRLTIVQGKMSDAALLQQVRQAYELIDESLEESRSLTSQLSPLVLYELGLTAALPWLGQQMREQHGLAVEVQAAPDANPTGEETAVLLFHAVRELLFNVTKHAGVGAARVRLDRADGAVRVTVEDRGRGFDPAEAAAVDVTKGCFGLFAIRERLEALGGQLTIDSAPGRGTRVTLLAPEAATAGPHMTPSASCVGPLQDSGASPRAIRVLLADDHPIVRSGLAALLQDHPDIEVIGEAVDGEMALDMTRQLTPDVVIMDVTMPRMNGLDATRLIVRELPDVRVIGLSIHGHEQMADSMRRAGAVAYLHKGGPPEALIAAIHHAVAPSATPASADTR